MLLNPRQSGGYAEPDAFHYKMTGSIKTGQLHRLPGLLIDFQVFII